MKAKKYHPVHVPGSAVSSNTLLGAAIGKLRYDQQPLIFRALGEEILEQAKGDRKRGRVKLATLLLKAEVQARMLAETNEFNTIVSFARWYFYNF